MRRAEARILPDCRARLSRPPQYGVTFRAETIVTADGERLRAVASATRRRRWRAVVYFHGNGGNLSIWSDILVGLWQQRFDVVAIDYRGYGVEHRTAVRERALSRCRRGAGVRARSRAAVRASADLLGTLARHARGRLRGVRAAAGRDHPRSRISVDASVLETNPVLWALSWLSSYRFPTAELDGRGDVARAGPARRPRQRDSVSPRAAAVRIGCPDRRRFVTIPGGDHNDAAPAAADAYWSAIRRFVEGLRTAAR